jgi:ketosteroid isomerase-like protein
MLRSLFALALSMTAAVAVASSTAESTLRALDDQLQQAVLHGDAATLDRLLADDWMLISSTGHVVQRADFIAAVQDPTSRLEVNQQSDVMVRVHGNAAIVTAALHERGFDHGKPYEAWLRYTDTWVEEGGSWRYVSGHACRVTPPTNAH